jgi:ribosomal protein S17
MIVVLMARALCLTVDIAVSFSQAYRKITKRTKKYSIIVDKNDARNP